MSLRDQILKAKDIVTEDVTVPEWDDAVIRVKTLTGSERARMLRSYTVTDEETGETSLDMEKMYPALLIATAHDPNTGEKVFTEEDSEALNEKSGAALERVAEVAVRLAGLGGAKAVAEAGKDSSSTATPTTNQKGAST